jgi:hypothetical protein
LLDNLNEIVWISFGCRPRDTSVGTNGGETLGVLGRAGLDDRGDDAGKDAADRPVGGKVPPAVRQESAGDRLTECFAFSFLHPHDCI